MKRTTLSMSALACVMTVGLAAQAPAGGAQTPSTGGAQPPSTGAPSAASSDAKNTVTVTGCLAKASASSTPTTGAAAPADTAKFVLNDVTADAPSSATAGAAGTSGSARPTASTYRIEGDDSKLTPHVGHKVAITGTVDSRSAGAASATAGADGPKLKVESVKMIAASCTP